LTVPPCGGGEGPVPFGIDVTCTVPVP